MNEIEIFYLASCPYCVKAQKAAAELRAEKPDYAALPLRWIEESRERELADSRDYYYVPTFFYAGEKLYECSPRHGYEDIKTNIKTVFDTVLSRPEA